MLGRAKQHKASLVVGLLLVILFAGCHWHDHSTAPAGHGQRMYVEDLEYQLDGIEVSSIGAHTINGAITVAGISGTQGRVRVHKKVRAHTEWEAEEFAHRVRIHFDHTADGVTIDATYPETPHGVSVEVSYDIDCARETDLVLSTVNGRIAIDGIHAAASATTVNGHIEANLKLVRGNGLFVSTNGSIDVGLSSCRVPMTVTTANGAIDVALPSGFSGLLHAQTVNGRVRCEIPLSHIYTRTPKHLSGRIGAGRDTPITLHTANGSIRASEY